MARATRPAEPGTTREDSVALVLACVLTLVPTLGLQAIHILGRMLSP